MSVNGTGTVAHVLTSQSHQTLQRSVVFAEAVTQAQVQTKSTSALDTATGIVAGILDNSRPTFSSQPPEDLPSPSPTTTVVSPPSKTVQASPPASDVPTSTSGSIRTPLTPSPPLIFLEILVMPTTLMSYSAASSTPPVTLTNPPTLGLASLVTGDSTHTALISSYPSHDSLSPQPSSLTTAATNHQMDARKIAVGLAVATGILALAIISFVACRLRKRLFARHLIFRDFKAPINEALLEALPEPYNLNPFDATSANKVNSPGVVLIDADSHVEGDPFADDPLGRTSRTSSLPSYRS